MACERGIMGINHIEHKNRPMSTETPQFETQKTPDQIKDDRLKAIISELEDAWAKDHGGVKERPLSEMALAARKGRAAHMRVPWNGKTTEPTSEFNDFYYGLKDGESVVAKAKKLLTERYPEYAEEPTDVHPNTSAIESDKPVASDAIEDKPMAPAPEKELKEPVPEIPETPNVPETPRASAEKTTERPNASETPEAPKPPETEIELEIPPEPETEAGFVETFRRKLGIDNAIDSAKIAYNGFLTRWHGDKEAHEKDSIASLKSEAESLEKDAKHIEEQLRFFRADGNISEKTLLKIEAEKQRIEGQLGGTLQGLNEAAERLKSISIDRQIFENKRNDACRTYDERMRAELSMFENEASDLSATHAQLEREIAADTAALSKRRADLAVLAERVEAEKFPSLQQASREIIRHIEAEAALFEKEIAGRERHKLAIEKDILKTEQRARPFREKSEQLEAIMSGTDIEFEEAQADAGAFSGATEVVATTESATAKRSAETASGALPPERTVPVLVERPHIPEMFSVDELIAASNEANGSSLIINPETFKKEIARTPKGRTRKRMSVDEFMASASLYSARFANQERRAGMSKPEKVLSKKRGFWSWLFGLGDSPAGKARLFETLKNRSRSSLNPQTT